MLPELWRHRGAFAGPSFEDFVDRFFYGWPSETRESKRSYSPNVDINESDTEVYLDVDLPGIDKKDIHVEVKNNTLTISGERQDERRSEDSQSCRVEKRYGRFERSFTLPDTVNADKVAAEYTNGVLSLTLPKIEKAIPKEIQVAVK